MNKDKKILKKQTKITDTVDRSVINKIKFNEIQSDFKYWQTQSYESRLETLESIRKEYIRWKYGTEQRLHRVYTIVKRS